MSKDDAGRIQSSQVHAIFDFSPQEATMAPRANSSVQLQAKSGGDMGKGGFAARAQAAGHKNANATGNNGDANTGNAPQN